ncbi:MAG: hypothetical protein JWM86_2996 [Thermoleophilia bacterium]|nr:hypothetical protein [Thermoleophilia bacterium]
MALLLALRRGGGKRAAALALTGVVLVAVSGAAQVNQQFQAYPSLRGVLGLPLAAQVRYADLPHGPRPTVIAAPGQPLAGAWRPPAGQAASGVVTTVAIPGTRSGFRARAAWAYLPPAYQSTPRPLLPVVVLIAGQPGAPRDWFDGGQVNLMMDRYAATHQGLAPVVVVPDALGSRLADPLCVNSSAGRVFTYLSLDVPAWIDANLQVDPDRAHWAVGGISAGATCALQLAVGVPSTYPTALVLSGQREPTLGDRARTVRKRFGGNTADFRAANPLDVLARRRFLSSAAVVAVGAQDSLYGAQADALAAGMRSAGMTVRRATAPGGHSWLVWRKVLAEELPWLGFRLAITAAPPPR